MCALANLTCFATAHAAAPDEVSPDVRARFHVAPAEDAAGTAERLLRVWVNGVDAGVQRVLLQAGQPVLPADVATTLRLQAPDAGLVLQRARELTYSLTEASGELHITVPEASLLPLTIGAPGIADLRLSPESWGVWVDYDVNMRLGASGLGGGGYAQLRATGPDVSAVSSWASSAATQTEDSGCRCPFRGGWV